MKYLPELLYFIYLLVFLDISVRERLKQREQRIACHYIINTLDVMSSVSTSFRFLALAEEDLREMPELMEGPRYSI